MFLLSEETRDHVLKQGLAHLSKLKNQQMHLSELINKRNRLNVEIKTLQLLISKSHKSYESNLRKHMKLKEAGTLDSSTEKLLLETNPEVYLLLFQMDEIARNSVSLRERTMYLSE